MTPGPAACDVRDTDTSSDEPAGHPGSDRHPEGLEGPTRTWGLRLRALPTPWWRGWLGPLAVTLLAGFLRFRDLGRPHAVVFDETYYVKDGLSLWRYGHERKPIEGANDLLLGGTGHWRQLDIFTSDPEYVVHPPVGKWLIGAGQVLFGVNPFGWRFMGALLGTLSVLLLARILRRLFRSDLIGTLAGLLLAVDGLHLVLSRTAILDIFLMFFVLAAFGCLVVDRDRVRERVAARDPDRHWGAELGPRLGWRPWRVAAGVCLGLACGVKWSGLWYVAFLGLLCVAWDLALRRQLGVRRPVLATAVSDVAPALLSVVGVGLLTYIASWSGWLLTDGGYYRDWAAATPGAGVTFLPDALRSLVFYHQQAWNFHVGLHTPHSYQSSAWSWPFMTRPTSFYYQRPEGCGAEKCSSAVLAVGNPVIWWAGVLALGHNAWRAIAGRDWRCGALLVGYAAGWLPWLLYHDRTIFTFYAVVMVPFLCGMLAVTLASLAGGRSASPSRRTWGIVAAAVVVLLVILVAWRFLPVWTAQTITYEQWYDRMWMPSWI